MWRACQILSGSPKWGGREDCDSVVEGSDGPEDEEEPPEEEAGINGECIELLSFGVASDTPRNGCGASFHWDRDVYLGKRVWKPFCVGWGV